MSYRIIQWGSGNVGRHALRHIVERPDFKLVGLRVYNPDKVGKDAGELIGAGPTGVLATDNIEEILALDADCVSYSPLGTTLDRGEEATKNICRLLASGKNVVSSAVEYHAYFRPDLDLAAASGMRERLEKACVEGGSTFLHVGINPGYFMDFWPVAISRLCRRIDHMRITEILDMSDYDSVHMLREGMGFGLPPGGRTVVDRHMENVYQSPFYLCMRMITDSIGVKLDDLKYHREFAVTDNDLKTPAGIIEAGTVSAMKLHFDGIVADRVAIALEWVWRVDPLAAPEWPSGHSRWMMHIEGDPVIDTEIAMRTSFDAGRAGSLGVSTLVLNAVPTVCAAPPGLLDNLKLPLHGGGYFPR